MRTPIRNVHTGDWLKSKAPTDEYRAGWDLIFGKKKAEEEKPAAEKPEEEKPE